MKKDLGRLITEQRNPASAEIDGLPVERILEIINNEDAKVAPAVRREIPQIARAVETIVAALRAGGRLFYVGSGSAGRTGAMDAAECPPTFNTPPEKVQAVMAGGPRALLYATEASEDSASLGRRDLQKRRLRRGDVVVGVSASGRTPYTVGALRYARRRGAATVAVTSNPDSLLSKVADITIATVVDPEVIAGSSRMKSGTAQKLVLNMLSTASMIRLGYVYGNQMVNVHLKNRKLRDRGLRMLESILQVDRARAARALRRAGNNLKAAIVMHQKGLERAEAARLLARHDGNVRKALDQTSDLGPQASDFGLRKV